MDKKQMKDAFEILNPTKEQTDKMWERLSETVVQKDQKIRWKKRKIMRRVAAAAVILLVVSLSGVGINVAADGALVDMITEAIGLKQGSQDVIGQAEEIQDRGIEVYAPDILSVDESVLVFGNLRGLLIYDVQKKELMGTIDTQAIDCMYFNGENKQTCVLKEGDALILFNTENKIPFGSYHQFQLEKGNELALTPIATGTDEKQLQQYYKAWKKAEENYIDTFHKFHEYGVGEEGKNHTEIEMYSERSIKWKDANGEEFISYVTVKNNAYHLNTYQTKTDSIVTEKINLNYASEEKKEEIVLPEFVYTGDDMAMKAITEYLQKENDYYRENGEVWIPGFVIIKRVEKRNELLVFGNFWSYGYLLNGTILESTGGGEMPACFHLKKNGNAYEVVSVDTTGDGSEYAKGIKKFTRGYPGLYDKFMDKTDSEREEACKEYIQMYAREYRLPIQYYKEFGWDPVKIFE